MTRTLLVTLAALLASTLIAWRLGGTLGVGVAAGFLCGASVAGLGAAWQRRAIHTRPEHVYRAHVEAFLFKLVALVAGALVFRFVEQAAARVDWRSFLVTFVSVGFAVMVIGAFDNARALQRPRAAEQGGGR